jgi:pyruvate dehydrogenase E1 component beta subunit
VVSVATPYDAKGLLKTAIRDPNPVIFFESELMYGVKGEVPDEEYLIPFGQADIKRAGNDVTLVCWGQSVPTALETAELAAADGIDVEVIDLLSLRPLDMETVLASVRKTNRAVVAYHGWRLGGVGPEIVDQIQRDAFDWLDAPVLRVCYDDIPMAYAENLEHLTIPQADRIYASVRKVLYRD